MLDKEDNVAFDTLITKCDRGWSTSVFHIGGDKEMRVRDRQKLIAVKDNIVRAHDNLQRVEREIWMGLWGDKVVLEYIREAEDLVHKAKSTMQTLLGEIS